MPAYNTYSVTMNISTNFTLTDRDHTIMTRNGWTPGVEADEIAYIQTLSEIHPLAAVHRYLIREAAEGRPARLPAGSVTATPA